MSEVDWPQDAKDFAASARKELDRIGQLLTDERDVAEVEHGQHAMEVARLNIRVRELEEFVRYLANSYGDSGLSERCDRVLNASTHPKKQPTGNPRSVRCCPLCGLCNPGSPPCCWHKL